jgi:hypothetical protein
MWRRAGEKPKFDQAASSASLSHDLFSLLIPNYQTTMKYQIPLQKMEHRTATVYADSPHRALEMALAIHEGFHADYIAEMGEDPDEPGEELSLREYGITSMCEGCATPILETDGYYQWGGDDSAETCMKCGGADESHEPILPENVPVLARKSANEDSAP